MSYGETIRQTLHHAMDRDPSVLVMGIGVDDHKAVFGSTLGLSKDFGTRRVIDTPISEAAMTGVAIGAAVGGMRPVHVHMRCDFLYLAMDQLMNLAAKWSYMFGGRMSVPLVVRCVIGRSWGQGAQHSQSLQSFFMHVPGIKVVMPTTSADVQGLLLAAIADPNPVLVIEHRLLYGIQGMVPSVFRAAPFGQTHVRRTGKDVTVVANSYLVVEALKAAEFLSRHGIDIEIVDPVSLVPLNAGPIVESVRKTGRALVTDTSWVSCGTSAEIAALIAEKAWDRLRVPLRRLGNAPATCPVSQPLEKAFYPDAWKITRNVFEMMGRKFPEGKWKDDDIQFKGPF